MAALTPEQIHAKLSAKFGDAVGPLQPAKKDPFCTFALDRVIEICRFMKSDPELAFDFLQDETATDHPKDNKIRVVAHFYSYKHRHMFVAKFELDRSKPEMQSLEQVWKAANWLEREIHDLFGVNFVNHTDMRRIMLPYDWVGHPLRKDYSEAGGYHDISNVRDNPLDLYLTLDRQVKAAQAAAAPAAPAAAPAPAAPPAPAEKPQG
jgi:NADH-quinone oxidoreductase subunit C